MKYSLAIVAALAISGCAFADTTAYIATGSNQFGTVNFNTGAFNFIADLGATPSGLGQIGGAIYTGIEGGTTLYRVNTSNGSLSPVGSGDAQYLVFGSTTTGLYIVAADGGLWNVNPSTGASNLVGNTGIDIGANNLGMSTGSSTLLLAVGSNLYSIDTATAAHTLIGNTNLDGVGALVFERGSLFAGSLGATNAFYSINQTNGAPTFLAASAAPDYAWGLAPIVPEPASFALVGLAGIALAGFALRRTRAKAC